MKTTIEEPKATEKQQKHLQKLPEKGDALGGGGKGVEGDIESGGITNLPLYPKMTESPALRWAFIRKVYCIIAIQLLATVGVAAVFVFVNPIPRFILSRSTAAWAIYLAALSSPFLVLPPLLYFRRRHPTNIILLALYTFCVSLSVGTICAHSKGRVVFEAAILTATVVVGLTIYTFWAARRGHDFQFLWPFLFASLLMILVYILIQVCFPFGKVSMTIYGCLTTIVFCGFIIYDTENLIKRHTTDEYIVAAISLFLDVINIFTAQLTIGIATFGAAK